MLTKICIDCNRELDLINFNVNKKRGNIPISNCIECGKVRNKKWYKTNKLAADKKRKDYDTIHKEKLKLYQKQYRLDNLEKTKKAIKIWGSKEENKKRRREKDRFRRKYDPQYRMRMNLSKRIRDFIKKGNENKTLNLLGCNLSDFKEYLENKWLVGMSWENYGRNGWHIDHIKPCKSFDLTDPAQQKICFHYTNLQPLWECDNLSKQDFLPDGSRARDSFP